MGSHLLFSLFLVLLPGGCGARSRLRLRRSDGALPVPSERDRLRRILLGRVLWSVHASQVVGTTQQQQYTCPSHQVR